MSYDLPTSLRTRKLNNYPTLKNINAIFYKSVSLHEESNFSQKLYRSVICRSFYWPIGAKSAKSVTKFHRNRSAVTHASKQVIELPFEYHCADRCSRRNLYASIPHYMQRILRNICRRRRRWVTQSTPLNFYSMIVSKCNKRLVRFSFENWNIFVC